MLKGAYHKNWAELPEPYPKPMVAQENHFYARLLTEDYAGAVSELTAINQYMNHHITSKSEHEIAELFQRIAITEMRHFEMLGTTIKLLGIVPVIGCLGNNDTEYWSSKFVYYGSGIADKLSANISHEAEAIRNYRKHQKCIDDPYIKKLLERIIMDEEHHLCLFQEAKDLYCSQFY